MSDRKILEAAKQALTSEIVKYAGFVATKSAASPQNRTARQKLAEVFMALQAIEFAEGALPKEPAENDVGFAAAKPIGPH